MQLHTLIARQILDSRGNPTVEVDCVLSDASGTTVGRGRAAVPSGASTGSHEALELRDGNPSIYGGKSVLRAVEHVHSVILPALQGADVEDQHGIDAALLELDGTPNKSRLGANAILAVSMAVCRARADAEGVALWQSLARQYGCKMDGDVLLPTPMMNVLNGGEHTDWLSTNVQEYMIVPTGAASFSEAVRCGAEVFHTLKKLLHAAGHPTSVGDEGGFSPSIPDEQALQIVLQAVEKAGYTPGKDVHIALDAAATEWWKDGGYTLPIGDVAVSSAQLIARWKEWTQRYPIVSIEDGLAEDDWQGWSAMTNELGAELQIVGDDLLVTDPKRLQKAIDAHAANSILIKLNQIGTVTETAQAIALAHDNAWTAVVSHRSGETEDTFIAHLAVALKTGQIKTGSLSRTDRICKYNELLRIEQELGSRAVYRSPFSI